MCEYKKGIVGPWWSMSVILAPLGLMFLAQSDFKSKDCLKTGENIFGLECGTTG